MQFHVAEMREINGIQYMNDGGWVDSCTALVELHDGNWEIIEHNHVDPIEKPNHEVWARELVE